jgi:polyhydroxyalkanoate synthesis regulator phasin
MKSFKQLRSNLQEKSDYQIYHKDYSSAVQHALSVAKKKGYEVDMDDYERKVAFGPKKPSSGKTNSFSIKLTKNGKPVRQALQMQVYNMDNKKYELNMYIESVELDEAVDAKKVIAHLVKKGNNPKEAEAMVKKELAGAMKAYPNARVAKIAEYIRSVAEGVELDESVELQEAPIDTLKQIVKDKSMMPVKFKNGGSMKVDLTTASMILSLMDKLSSQNKSKLETMINKDKASFGKVLDFMHGIK